MNPPKIYDSWQEAGIEIKPGRTEMKTTCPQCSADRKNKTDKCLSVNAQKKTWNCHNCGWSGAIKDENYTPVKSYTKPEPKTLPLSDRVRQFFSGRGIEERTLEYFKTTESKDWMYGKGDHKEGETACINFNYYQDGELVNIKYRASGKRFRMVSGAKLVFYNLDAIKESDTAIITEGEIDCMSLYQCSYFSAVSVPNGASKGNQKLEYLDNCIDYFTGKKKIVIATDGDEAGQELRDELIRRLGRERCYVVSYPEGCKDANEVLLTHGSAGVRALIEGAEQLPLDGIELPEDVRSGSDDLYRNGFPRGERIGYSDFDNNLTFRQGEFTVVTGIPNSGKSAFVDQIMVRLAARHGWRFGIFSPEQQPTSLHVSNLIQKYVGEPFFGREQMNRLKYNAGVDFINDHFFFMKQLEIDTTIDGILSKAKELVVRKGIHGLLIDPYNYIEHKIPHGYSETQYISELLTKIKRFKEDYNVHVFLIAHPTKIQKDKKTGKYEVPTLYQIAGSSHFYNKADNGFTVYRDFETNIITVHVQKIRFSFVGKIGASEFIYDVKTGRYAHDGHPFEVEMKPAVQSTIPVPPPPEPIQPTPTRGLTDFYKIPLPIDQVPF